MAGDRVGTQMWRGCSIEFHRVVETVATKRLLGNPSKLDARSERNHLID